MATVIFSCPEEAATQWIRSRQAWLDPLKKHTLSQDASPKEPTPTGAAGGGAAVAAGGRNTSGASVVPTTGTHEVPPQAVGQQTWPDSQFWSAKHMVVQTLTVSASSSCRIVSLLGQKRRRPTEASSCIAIKLWTSGCAEDPEGITLVLMPANCSNKRPGATEDGAAHSPLLPTAQLPPACKVATVATESGAAAKRAGIKRVRTMAFVVPLP
mmetsp:Transcript_83698/g.269743  ORF Transcript_83698/g.269743 Transcript_83698/m.269743 type:complete len:212 (-) Transcript_83698:40-675(-)